METVPPSGRRGQATAGLVLGIVSMVAWFIPLIGYITTILGIVFSSQGRNSTNRGRATAGLVLSIIALILTLGNSAAGIYLNLHK